VSSAPEPKTTYLSEKIRLEAPELVVLTGLEKGKEFRLSLSQKAWRVGSSPDCDIRLADLASLHLELSVDHQGRGVRLHDHSEGQTRVNGNPVHEAVIQPGDTIDLGGIELRLQNADDAISILPSQSHHFGDALGRSLAMREVFGVLEVIAPTTASVLLLGETGSGKDVLARAIHKMSTRSEQKMLTLDCSAIAPNLVEAELFGYERGAFTGAEAQYVGAFERADGGTLFLDEVGELPLAVQPKLLRVLDDRAVQRVGGDRPIPVDVRVIAATKRNLEEETKRGRFREDLYFRLSVVPVMLPPLRERREDITMLVEAFRKAFAERTGQRAEIHPTAESHLLAHDWPGNVRELKNTIERALWLAQTGDGVARFALPLPESLMDSDADTTPDEPAADPNRSFSEHKTDWEAAFERKYLPWLLARAQGSLSEAARLAQMDRKHLRTLLKKHSLWNADG
jgi:transcriptional regulator with GAF, ATPase, and Fis domain